MKPKVGIFFFVAGEIIIDAVPLDEAELYGDALQHGGHYEFWESLIPKTDLERRFKARAYDAYPRGRVVYFPEEDVFHMYLDGCLLVSDMAVVLHRFNISGDAEFNFSGDEHYKCERCNLHYLE